VEVNGKRLTSRHIVIATGARPRLPALPGLDGFPTSPPTPSGSDCASPLSAGAGRGPIGCELAQSLALLGIPVTLVEQGPQLLPREDRDVAGALAAQLEHDGVTLHLGWQATSAEYMDGKGTNLPIRLHLRRGDETGG
jgi:pyruvate/2-oxoglutarate dehydrogenase complex dihydrolipoamide dehydrogenase (E3) component